MCSAQVQLLIDAFPTGAQAKDKGDEIPLQVAAARPAEVGVVKALVLAFPDGVRESNVEQQLPLHIAADAKADVDVIEVLLQAYPDGAVAAGKGGLTALPEIFV